MRHPQARWHERSHAWRSDVGDLGATGRRKPVYFRLPYGAVRSPAWRAAQRALEVYLESRVKVLVSHADPTVEALCQLYVDHAAKHRAARTVKDHGYRLLTWCRFQPSGGKPYGDRKAAAIGPEDLELFASTLMREGKGARYVAGLLRSVKAAWVWAARPIADRVPRRLIPSNPLVGSQAPTIPQNPVKYVAPAVVERFLAWVEASITDKNGLTARFDRITLSCVRLIAETGCRPGEAVKARWDQIDWAGSKIEQRLHKTSGKTGRPRVIHLTPAVVADLRMVEAMEGRHPEWVYTHKRGKGAEGRGASAEAGEPWDVQSLGSKVRKWREAAIAAGIDLPPTFSLYWCRHSYASDALMTGASPAETGAALGTSARMIESTYGSITSDHTAELARRVAERRRSGGE